MTKTMEDYKTDSAIMVAIIQGHHNFNKIYDQVRHVNSSKFQFADRMELLEKSGLIKKNEIKKKKTSYFLGDEDDSIFGVGGYDEFDLGSYEEIKDVIDSIKDETLSYEKKSKKYSDTKLLQESIKDIVMMLKQLSYVSFRGLVTKHKTEQAQIHEWEKEIRELIKKRIKILEKREPKLVKTCHDLTANELIGIDNL